MKDKDDNYSLITYKVTGNNTNSTLSVSQKGFINDQAKEHSENSWAAVLEEIKKIAEN